MMCLSWHVSSISHVISQNVICQKRTVHFVEDTIGIRLGAANIHKKRNRSAFGYDIIQSTSV